MSRAAVLAGVLTVAVVAALAAWYLRADYETPPVSNAPARSAVPVPAPEKLASVRVGEADAKPLRTLTKAPATNALVYAAQYLGAADLLSFLEALAPAAAEGDVDALYYMGRASWRCTREYSTLFGPPGREKTLEVALEKNYWTKNHEQLARKIYGQCARFKAAANNPFNEWENLIEAAAEAGNGPAKALLVLEMGRGGIRMRDGETREQLSSEIRALAKEAIRTKDPEVLFQFAYIDSISGRSGTAEDMAGAWMLAACQRGLECGRASEQFQFFCKWDPECKPSETLVDLWRRRPRFDEFQRFANELNAKLDADRFDEIIP
jgi:hypothetical protein